MSIEKHWILVFIRILMQFQWFAPKSQHKYGASKNPKKKTKIKMEKNRFESVNGTNSTGNV